MAPAVLFLLTVRLGPFAKNGCVSPTISVFFASPSFPRFHSRSPLSSSKANCSRHFFLPSFGGQAQTYIRTAYVPLVLVPSLVDLPGRNYSSGGRFHRVGATAIRFVRVISCTNGLYCILCRAYFPYTLVSVCTVLEGFRFDGRIFSGEFSSAPL